MTGSKYICHIFCVETKKKDKKISRKLAGISRKFAGISRKFADRCFNQFITNMSSICGHGMPWPKNFKTRPLYLLCPKNQFPETMVPRPKTERGLIRLWVPKFGKNHLSHFFDFIAIFVFHRIFLNQNGPSRFFLHLGFAGIYYELKPSGLMHS